MRLLLDESVPATLRRHIVGHEVRTVVEMGGSGVKNGKLLALAAVRATGGWKSSARNWRSRWRCAGDEH